MDSETIDRAVMPLEDYRRTCDIVREKRGITKKISSGELAGEIELIKVYPEYKGETEVTPSSETLILSTAEKTLLDNIKIQPIPSNYGLITWNGSFLTVS